MNRTIIVRVNAFCMFRCAVLDFKYLRNPRIISTINRSAISARSTSRLSIRIFASTLHFLEIFEISHKFS